MTKNDDKMIFYVPGDDNDQSLLSIRGYAASCRVKRDCEEESLKVRIFFKHHQFFYTNFAHFQFCPSPNICFKHYWRTKGFHYHS